MKRETFITLVAILLFVAYVVTSTVQANQHDDTKVCYFAKGEKFEAELYVNNEGKQILPTLVPYSGDRKACSDIGENL